MIDAATFPDREFARWTAVYLLDTAQNLDYAFNDDQLVDLALALLLICLVSQNDTALNGALYLERQWREMDRLNRFRVHLKASDAYIHKITGKIRRYPFGQIWWGVIAPSRNRYNYTLKRLDEKGAVRWQNIAPHQLVEIELDRNGLDAYHKVYGNLPWGSRQ